MSIPQEQLDSMLAEAKRACNANEAPRYGNGAVQSRPEVPPLPSPEPQVFDWTHLGSRKLRRLERFEMPDGAYLWVAPFTGELTRELTLRSGGVTLDLAPGDPPAARDAKVRAAAVELQAMQVSLVCFRDEEGTAPCFGPGHVPAILANLPYTVIQAICRLSESLCSAPTKEELEPFFACSRRLCAMLRLLPEPGEDALPGWKDTRTEFESCVSRLS